MSVVSSEVAHAESKSREVGHSASDTSFWPANEGLLGTDGRRGGRSPSASVGRSRRAGKTFHHSGVRARGLAKTCRFGSDQASSCDAFPANENVRTRYPQILSQTLPRQTSGKSNARTMSGTRSFGGTSRSK